MIGETGNVRPRPASADPDTRLRYLSKELEGIFFRQLLEVMHEEPDPDSPFGASEGETLFRSLLDDHIASAAAQHMERGLGDAMYRQLREKLPEPVQEPRISSGGKDAS